MLGHAAVATERSATVARRDGRTSSRLEVDDRRQPLAHRRVCSKLKVQNSSTSKTFKDPNYIFQAPKLSTKIHILDADIQNLRCNVTLTSACFKIVNKCKISKFARFKFEDFSKIFKYFQAPYLFSSTLKGLEVFIPNSSCEPCHQHISDIAQFFREIPGCCAMQSLVDKDCQFELDMLRGT